MTTVRYLSLFAGIGGFELGLEAAGAGLGIDFECVGYSEIDKWALRTYERHFDHRAFGDVTQIEPATLPEFDLLVAGFPCQPFSTAGGRLGFDDERGNLFFDIARILQHSRPRHFILENVAGLLGHDAGETFKAIIGVLTRMGSGLDGYAVEWQVLDSQDYGVPQSRERIFIVGHLGGTPGRLVFPMGNNVGRKVDGDPKRSGYGDRVFSGPVEDTPAGELTGFVRSKAPGIHAWASRSIATTIDANYGSGPGYGGNRTHVGRVDNGVLRLRKLTPVEAERCEGLPDNWTAGHSATQRYRQIGNAVVPQVVEAIATELYQHAQINLPGNSLP
ncbi:MAG: DNA cytosine methyltransferase [Arthrobacter sp.]